MFDSDYGGVLLHVRGCTRQRHAWSLQELICMHTHTHKYTHIHTHTNTHTWARTGTLTYTHPQTNTHTHTHRHTNTNTLTANTLITYAQAAWHAFNCLSTSERHSRSDATPESHLRQLAALQTTLAQCKEAATALLTAQLSTGADACALCVVV